MSLEIGSEPRAALLNRQREREALEGLVEAARLGRGWALVVRGEAGVGKTALLDYVVDASGLRVVRATGVESEMELAFAGLHQLCSPVLDVLERLPVPQRDALEVAFGVRAGGAPDGFLVGLAVLTLLAEAAEERPLLCVVDDAQWLDRASAQVLAFVARRLLAEPVGLIFVAREPREELWGLRELEVRGLPNEDARALLRSVVRFRLDDQVRDRVLAEAKGNPLALLELPRGLSPTELAGGFGLLEAQAVPARVEESFRHRLEGLPGDTRRLLLVAAAEPVGDPALVWRAAERLEIETSAAVAAEADGLLEIGTRVQFRHPLVRSAVYRSASLQERQATHLALAEVTDRELDPDRRAWHSAAATPGPDEEVASDLERSAGRAQARGGLAAAAAFLQRSVALTREPARRAARALAAAQAHLQSGAFAVALELLTIVESGALDAPGRAQVDLLRGQIAFAGGRVNDASQLLLKAAQGFEPFDLGLARETYLTAWASAAHNAGGSVQLEICRAIQALPRPLGAPHPLDLALDGLALLTTEGPATASSTLQRAAKALADLPVDDVLRWGWVAPGAVPVWDFESKLAIATRQLQLVRDAGALAALPIHLSVVSLLHMQMGDFSGAASLVAETDSVAAATGSDYAPYTALRLQALRGEAGASAAVASAIERTAVGGYGTAAPWAYLAAAELYNGLARYEEAAAAARQSAASTYDPWNSSWALPELVEAAARTGESDLARDALVRLSASTRPSATDYGLGIEARCRALLSDGVAAEELYREAVERLGSTRLRPELARAHLLYGEWLRRENRRVDSRQELRTAYGQLTAIGMEAFAERARRELSATGETARKRTAEARDELTPQEAQIADLARTGLSNPQIAGQLFLSPHTVEYHLRKVFAKLEISSRHQLERALPDLATAAPTG